MRALVFGATGALGRAVASRLRADGWDLWLHGNHNGLIVDELMSDYGARVVRTCDIRDQPAVAELCKAAAGPEERLEAVVYAVGVNPTAASIATTDLKTWEDTVAVNLTGAFIVAKEALPYLRSAAPGRLVFVSSIFGIEASPNRGAYSAAKHGLTGLVQALAREEAPHVITNAVAPGPMWTESVRKIFAQHARERDIPVEDYVKQRVSAIPAGRFLEPGECADVIAFLVSDRCRFVSGEVVKVTGGSPI